MRLGLATRPRPELIWAVLVAVATAAYAAAYGSRVLAVSSGNELFLGEAVLSGRMPYRDFYFTIPPLTVIQYAFTMELLGERLATIYAVSIGVRAVGALCAYLWLSRLFPRAPVGPMVIVAFVAASGDLADSPSHYHHLVTAYLMVAGWLVDLGVRAHASFRAPIVFALAGGAVAASALTKHTSGPIVAVGLCALLSASIWRLDGRRPAVMAGVAFMVGVLVPIGAVGIWLARHEALEPFVLNTLLAGPSAKGGLAGSALRIARLSVSDLWPVTALGLAGTGLLLIPRPSVGARTALLVLGGLGAWAGWHWRMPQLAACYVSLVGSGALAAVSMWRFAATRDRREARIALAGVLASGAALGLALSWPAYEPMVLPGFVLVAAFSWEMSARAPAARLALAGGLAVLLVCSTVWKTLEPFSWERWREPPLWADRASSGLHELQGLSLAARTVDFIDNIAATIRVHARPGDRMLVYPLMANLYALSRVPPATYAYSHFMDICPDGLARADAERLAADPPAIMVLQMNGPQHLSHLERQFRNGSASGQRDLEHALIRLAPSYALVKRWENASIPAIEVWVRRDAKGRPTRAAEVDAKVSDRAGSATGARGPSAP